MLRSPTTLLAVLVLCAACGADAADSTDGGAALSALPAPPPVDVERRAREPLPAAPSAEAVPEAQAAESEALEELAIWPAAGVTFGTAEEAATDFVAAALGVEPVLGGVQSSDPRSSEIDVMSNADGASVRRATLTLRQLRPTDGWYVVGARSDGVTISSPEAGAEVPAGQLTVTGEGRGFETTLNVVAFAAGDASTELDLEIAAGGAFEQLEPYQATVDLSDAEAGDVVVVLVRGDTGLDNDPGEFAAIPVVIADGLPASR